MYGKRINEIVVRPSKKLLEQFRDYATPDICDAEIMYDAMDSQIKPWVGKGTVIGPAFTVKVPNGEGDMIVIAGHGNCGCLTGAIREVLRLKRKVLQVS